VGHLLLLVKVSDADSGADFEDDEQKQYVG